MLGTGAVEANLETHLGSRWLWQRWVWVVDFVVGLDLGFGYDGGFGYGFGHGGGFNLL